MMASATSAGGKIHPGEAWEVSHPIALANGGEDVPENRKPAHKKCHRHLTATIDIPAIAKTKRRHAKHIGAKQRTGFRGWRRFNDTLVWKDRP